MTAAFSVFAQLPDTKVFQFERSEPVSGNGGAIQASLQVTDLAEPRHGTSLFEDTVELKLFNNAADVKIQFGEVLRHLSVRWRPEVFAQIDELLDPNAWNDESSLIDRRSFGTFLRFLDFARPSRLPALGISHDGNLMAAWILVHARVFVTFMSSDRVEATFLGQTDRGEEQITAWRGPVASLKDRVTLEGAGGCLFDAGVADDGSKQFGR